MKRKFFMVTLLICFVPLISLADDSGRFSGRVSIMVSANEAIKGQTESFMSRELRSLGDIVVTDNKPDWVLSVVSLEIATDSTKIGFALSVVILEPFDQELVLPFVMPVSKGVVNIFTMDLYRFLDHWIRTGGTQDLRGICSGIVADFDTRHIKPAREQHQERINRTKTQ